MNFNILVDLLKLIDNQNLKKEKFPYAV